MVELSVGNTFETAVISGYILTFNVAGERAHASNVCA